MNGAPHRLKFPQTRIGSGKLFDLLIISAVCIAVPGRDGFQVPHRVEIESGRKSGGVGKQGDVVLCKGIGKVADQIAAGALGTISAQSHDPVIGLVRRAVVAGVLTDGQKGIARSKFMNLFRNGIRIETVHHPVPLIGRRGNPLAAVLRRMERTARI